MLGSEHSVAPFRPALQDTDHAHGPRLPRRVGPDRRRRRYYLLRVVYGFALLLLVRVSYLSLVEQTQERGGSPSIADVASFALATFLAFAGLQIATILVLVPALFGGVIADE